jgi:hypothetical protein
VGHFYLLIIIKLNYNMDENPGGKFIHDKPNGIAHCPYCRGVLLRDFKKSENCTCVSSFAMRCPHCEETVRVQMDNGKIAVAQMPSESGDKN